MSHVDEGLLTAYVDGAFDADTPERDEIETHLAECADCRVRLEDARRLREDAQRVLGQLAPPAQPAPQWSEIVAARAARQGAPAGGGSASLSSPRRDRPFRRLAWAASLVLALGAGWMARAMFTVPQTLPAALDESSATIRPAPTAVQQRDVAADAVAEPPAAARAATAEHLERAERRAAEAEREVAPPGAAAGLAAPRAPALADVSAEAQQKAADSSAVLTGRVTDEAGVPLPNVQVVVAGTSLGTLTDTTGRFRIANVPAGEHRVAARLIGFETSEQRLAVVSDSAAVSFRLGQATVALDEVVVRGAATPQRSRALAATVNTVTPVSALESAVEHWDAVSVDEAAAALGIVPVLPSDTSGMLVHMGESDGTTIVRVEWMLDGAAIRLLQVRYDGTRADELVPAGEQEALQILRGLRVLVRAPDPETLAEAVRRLR